MENVDNLWITPPKNVDNSKGWLVLLPDESVNLQVDMSSAEKVMKHFDRDVGRFYLHYDQTCVSCMEGIPIRLRYTLRVIFDGLCWQWEVGKSVYSMLRKLAGSDQSINIVVIRQGSGRQTRYWINRASEVSGNIERNNYIRQHLGHRLRR
jgi:hypothetical protein